MLSSKFTSILFKLELLKELFQLTTVRTVQENKREILQVLLMSNGRITGNLTFCFNQELTLVSYLCKQSKVVLVMSTCCEVTSITYPVQKPEIIERCNSTKGIADTFE